MLLGGLFTNLKLYPFMDRGDSDTFKIWTSGFYSTSNGITNEEGKPNGESPNGNLLVFDSGWYGVKIYKPHSNPYLYVQTKGGSVDSYWYKFTGTKL